MNPDVRALIRKLLLVVAVLSVFVIAEMVLDATTEATDTSEPSSFQVQPSTIPVSNLIPPSLVSHWFAPRPAPSHTAQADLSPFPTDCLSGTARLAKVATVVARRFV